MDRPDTSKIELKSRTLPVLVGIIFTFQLFGAYKGWMILLVGLGGAWLLAYLWARSLANGLSITREKRYPWAKVGDIMLERFYLTNEGWAEALWVAVKDHSDLPGYDGDKITNVEGHSIKTWMIRNHCSLRGLYTFGPTSLETGDPFGIYRVNLHLSTTNSVVVLPPVVSLPSISIAAGERAGEGRSENTTLERTVSSASIREFVPGDNFRSIHWPQSARRDDLYVRVFDGTFSSDWWIILDMDKEAHFGRGENSTEEHSVVLAASLADRGRNMGRSIGLVAHGQKIAWLPPNFGPSQHWEIMRTLALLKPGPDSLASVLARTQPALSQRTSVVVITPSVDGIWLESLIGMMRRGIAVTVMLLDPVSFGGRGDTRQTEETLAAWGARYYRVTPDLVDLTGFAPDQKELHTIFTSLRDASEAGAPNGDKH
jgi:uncharacterized protein (DUF58 family)